MHHQEEGLLEGIAYFGGHLQDDPQQLFDALRQGDGQIDAAPDFDRTLAQTAATGRVRHKAIR